MERVQSAGFQIILSCEHASARIPPEYAALGLSAEDLASHVAWDPGAQTLCKALEDGLRAPTFYGEFSRLLIDLNRPEESLDVIPQVAFGLAVPGNRTMDEAERNKRLHRYHRPYWAMVQHEVAQTLQQTERNVLHLSIHSFVPELHGQTREVEIGFLFDTSRPIEQHVVDHLAAAMAPLNMTVRSNEPYLGTAEALTTSTRALHLRRYAGVEIEMSHSLIGREQEIAKSLLAALPTIPKFTEVS